MLKTADVTITAPGRDTGKVFVITEMSARQLERWERRALACMVQTGVQVPEDISNVGLGYVLTAGLKALLGMSGPEVEALHDELMACVALRPSPKEKPEIVRPLIEQDIEDATTIYQLKDEVVKLHLGFSIAAYLSMAWRKAAEMAMGQVGSSDTQTSAGS